MAVPPIAHSILFLICSNVFMTFGPARRAGAVRSRRELAALPLGGAVLAGSGPLHLPQL